jgi:hypothetical protein
MHPECVQAMEDEREINLDKAESVILDALEGGDLQTTKFYLMTIGKKRGYSERHELTGADGVPLVKEVEIPKRDVNKPDDIEIISSQE